MVQEEGVTRIIKAEKEEGTLEEAGGAEVGKEFSTEVVEEEWGEEEEQWVIRTLLGMLVE